MGKNIKYRMVKLENEYCKIGKSMKMFGKVEKREKEPPNAYLQDRNASGGLSFILRRA